MVYRFRALLRRVVFFTPLLRVVLFRVVLLDEDFFAPTLRAAVFLVSRFGSFFRSTLAMSWSSFSLIDLTMPFEAPLRLDFGRSPRLAERAAPAAICCFLDFALAMQREQRTRRSVPARRYREEIDWMKRLSANATNATRTNTR